MITGNITFNEEQDMAYNPSPKVRKAEKFAKEFGFDKIIVVGIKENDGTLETISYGKNKAECKLAKKLAGIAYDSIYNYYE